MRSVRGLADRAGGGGLRRLGRGVCRTRTGVTRLESTRVAVQTPSYRQRTSLLGLARVPRTGRVRTCAREFGELELELDFVAAEADAADVACFLPSFKWQFGPRHRLHPNYQELTVAHRFFRQLHKILDFLALIERAALCTEQLPECA